MENTPYQILAEQDHSYPGNLINFITKSQLLASKVQSNSQTEFDKPSVSFKPRDKLGRNFEITCLFVTTSYRITETVLSSNLSLILLH
jgi:hypothetical protein